MKTTRAIPFPAALLALGALATPPASAQQQFPVVYAGTSTSKVVRIDMEDGCIDWVKQLPDGAVIQAIAAARDGDQDTPPILAGTSDKLYLLHGKGTLNSSFPYGVEGSSYHQTTPIAFDTAGEYAVVAHNDGKVRLYEVQQSPFGFSVVWSYDFDARSVAIDGVGNRLAVAGDEGVAYFHHLRDGSSGWSKTDGFPTWTHALQGPAGPVAGLTVAITPAGGAGELYVAVGSDDRRVFLYDEQGTPQWTYDSSRGRYMSVAIEYDGTMAACGNDDPTDQNGAQLDGIPTSSGTAWTFVPSDPKPGNDCYALVAQHHNNAAGEVTWFGSGGSGSYGVFVHDLDGSLVWSGNPVRQRHRMAMFDSRLAGYTYVVTADINKPEVHVYKTDQKNPRHVIQVDGNCRALATAWGPDMGPAPVSCPIGTRYCSSSLNSAGTEAFVYALGSDVASEGDLTLMVTGCVPKAPGIFILGFGQAQVPIQYGTLCIAPPIARVPYIVKADSLGVGSLLLPPAHYPPGGPIDVHFQYWYRDLGHPTQARMSDGVTVTFH